MIPTNGIRGNGMNSVALLALSAAVGIALAGCPSVDDGKCDDVSDCLAGELCIDSRCGRPALGSLCRGDHECPEGAMCEGGRCAARCDEQGACPNGQVCSAQAGGWRASCIPACDDFGGCPNPGDVCTPLSGGKRGCVRKDTGLSACVGTSNLSWCLEPIEFVCGSDSFIDECWEYEGGVNYCPGISRLAECSWEQMSCACPENTVAVDCFDREPCSPNCFSTFGTNWGCQSFTEWDPSLATCGTKLQGLRATCHCDDGSSYGFDGCVNVPMSCEEVCSENR